MLTLTNSGLRVTQERIKADRLLSEALSDVEARLLLDLYTGLNAPDRDDDAQRALIARGLIDHVPDSVCRDDIDLRYRRNPLEHVERVIFELTTCCNFNCAHCYNATVPRVIERDIEMLKRAVDVFVAMGVQRFDFIGGEVSKYGLGWLDLARHIRSYGDEIIVALYTNGWWLEQQDFWAAGHTYGDVATYLADLKNHGVSHIAFSLDGQGAAHDRSRHQPGLYDRILRGLVQVREAGLQPRVSLLARDIEPLSKPFLLWLAEIADRMYEFAPETSLAEKALRVFEDRTNTISHFIDVGNGARGSDEGCPLSDIPDGKLYCRNYYRPAPSLTIKASGELATCRISNAGEGYGNLHEQPLIEILNHLQDRFVYRLHAERRLGEYRHLIDPAVFGNSVGHLCTYRAILTLFARHLHEEQIDPTDQAALAQLNRLVAGETGHHPDD